MGTKQRLEKTIFAASLAVFCISAACVTLPSTAHAQACAGTEFEPKDVEIVKEPAAELECVTVSVEGTWYCGSSPFAVFRNDCSSELSIDDDSFQCGAPDNRQNCSTVSAESVGSVELDDEPVPDAGSRLSQTYSGELGGEGVAVTVKYKKVRDESSVSSGDERGGCAGQSPSQAPAALVLLFTPYLVLRRR